MAALRGLPDAGARNLLRLWLQRLGAAPLPATRLEEALSQLYTARADAQVCIAWQGSTLRRYRDEVWLVPEGACATGRSLGLGWRAFAAGARPRAGTAQACPGGIDPQRWEHGRCNWDFVTRVCAAGLPVVRPPIVQGPGTGNAGFHHGCGIACHWF